MTDARSALRRGTSDAHDRVDALFGQFRLEEAEDYRRFLIAHAMAFPAVEAALDDAGFAALLPDWPTRHRAGALAADLVALGATMPALLPAPAIEASPAQWGAAYVLEGSRLGGALLARSVPAEGPRAYLGAAQPHGAWRAFLGALDAALATDDDIATAIRSARAVFALFETAGQRMLNG
jgi:heme oxygenase (biliverdin-IX-beta and delta-forming)